MAGAAAAEDLERQLREVKEALRRPPPAEAIEGPKLRAVLREAYAAVAEGHRTLTHAWRAPLSLFGPAAEAAAEQRGVPAEVLEVVREAKRLTEEAACLGDRTDGYEAQTYIAHREQRGLETRSLLAHFLECEDLACRFREHLPLLQGARACLDAPGALSPASTGSQARSAERAAPEGRPSVLPTVILEPKDSPFLPQLSSFFGVVRKKSNEFVPRALELAVDAVAFAGTFGGRLAAPPVAAASSTSGVPAQHGPGRPQAARPAAAELDAGGAGGGELEAADERAAWEMTPGRPAAWLDVVEGHPASRRRGEGATLPSELAEAGSAKFRFVRCLRSMRKDDRRWTLP